MKKNIHWGTVYNIFHEEYASDKEFFEQADADIDSMKAAGISEVLIFPMSQWDPERKTLQWIRTDHLIKKIESSGLKFVPLMFKEEQGSHYFPVWKFKENPRIWNEHHRKNQSRNNRENVDFAHPEVLPMVDAYFKEVIARYGKSPALSFYNVWNEPHYSSDADHTVDSFRVWLKKKYGSLSALRTSWGDEYTDWSEVTPFMNDNWNSSMPSIDWILFRNELNGRLLGTLRSFIRKYDTLHAVNANPVSSPFADFGQFGYYGTDNWAFTENNDLCGVSYYPDGWERGNGLTPYPQWRHNFSFTLFRSAAQPKSFILTELYTNAQNGFVLNGYLDEQSMDRLVWTALSNNCKGIIFWKWEPFHRGRQSLGRGLTTMNGTLAPRGEAVKEIGSVIRNYGPMLAQAELRPAQTAIAVDMVGLLKTLEQTSESLTNKFMYESIAGTFNALFQQNITTDIVRLDRGVSYEQLCSYKIIYLPFQIVIRKETAELLKRYVAQGGTVVADSRTASMDEFDNAYRRSPGAGLIDLFNVERIDWTGKNGTFGVTTKNEGTGNTFSFKGRYFREQLRVGKNAVIAGSFTDDGTPAVIINSFGKGKTVYSAVPLGASYFDQKEEGAKKFILQCANDAGAYAEAEFSSPSGTSLELKVHSSKERTIIYALNTETIDKDGTISCRIPAGSVKSVTNIITNKTIPFTVKNGTVIIPLSILKQETAVLMIQ
ncbi:MAG: beta-galactosidase [Bacteroidota bacterium]